MNETCYLKRFEYYPSCKGCEGNETNLCYNSYIDVQEHLAVLNRLFAERLETQVDESFEEMFEVHRGGFL